MVALENAAVAGEGAIDADEVQDPKRQRLEHPMDDILHFVKGALLPEKLYGLQMLVFIYDILPLDEGTLQSHLDTLLPCLSESDGSIVSWVMLAMTSYVPFSRVQCVITNSTNIGRQVRLLPGSLASKTVGFASGEL